MAANKNTIYIFKSRECLEKNPKTEDNTFIWQPLSKTPCHVQTQIPKSERFYLEMEIQYIAHRMTAHTV